MNLRPCTELPSKAVSIDSVRKALVRNTLAPDVASGIERLVFHDDYSYVAALVNQSKHRRIVSPQFSVDLTMEATPARLRFDAFDYHGRQYDARWVEPCLINEYGRQTKLVVEIGESLNKHLRRG